MFFLAQFDEVDEGTQFFKATVGSNVPVSNESVFQSYEDSSSQYLVWAKEASAVIDTAGSACPVPIYRVDNSFSKGIKIFPNPSSRFFTIEMPGGSGELKYNVFNTKRNMIRQGSSTNPLSRIDMNNVEKGIYIIRINADNQIKSHRLILK